MGNLYKLFFSLSFLVHLSYNAFSQGNTPCAATAIIVGSSCSYQSGTTVGATAANDGFGAIGCGTAGPDVWYTFSPTTSGSHTITTSSGGITDGVMQLYSSPNCNGTGSASIACNDDFNANMPQITANLTAGTTYYIRFWRYGGGTGTFNICVVGPAINDNCAGAISLTSNSSCSNTAGSVLGATQSLAACTGTANDDVWYSFQAVATTHTVTVVGSASFDPVFQVYSTSCGGTSLVCRDANGSGGTETSTLTGLTVGNTYWIRVFDYNSGVPSTTTFNICVTHSCGSGTSPADGTEICAGTASVTMSWATTAGAAGYNFYLGTNNPPTNIVNGTYQTTTSYVYSALTSGFTYYWQAIPSNGPTAASNCALQSFNVVPCEFMSNGTTTTCAAGFYDSGGPSGSAADNSNIVRTFCPANAGECIQATFYRFGTESATDLLYIYDGNSTAAPQLAGSPFSGNLPAFSRVGSTTNATGCLTFRYSSNSSFQSSGWDASIICAPCATAATYPPQDCYGGTTVCSDQAFAGNSDGQGIINDLNATNRGCLSTEHQSSWYYFSPATSGTIQLAITPANGTDDYDFAIWGPLAAVACPPAAAPLRCSYSAQDGSTGLNLSAADLSEGVGGDKWVDDLTVTAGQVYILCVDNYSASTQPFTLDWTLTNGATLSCVPLPIELLSFKGQQVGKKNLLEWTTATEINNDYFTIEKSTDGINFSTLGIVDGAGNSTQNKTYNFYDIEPSVGINYYRIKQTDFDGTTSLSGIVGIEFNNLENSVSNIHPNPTSKDFSFDFYSPINGTVKMQVLDYTGRVVLNDLISISEGKTTLSAEIGNLSSGIYSLKVVFEQTGFTAVNMLIKQ